MGQRDACTPHDMRVCALPPPPFAHPCSMPARTPPSVPHASPLSIHNMRAQCLFHNHQSTSRDACCCFCARVTVVLQPDPGPDSALDADNVFAARLPDGAPCCLSCWQRVGWSVVAVRKTPSGGGEAIVCCCSKVRRRAAKEEVSVPMFPTSYHHHYL